MPSPIVSGFYRYSDIFFEWHQALPDPGERSALKAFVANNSLVHPQNPLRRKEVDGIELFMGTMPTGQARLMFSSAQVEYMRYWLHAMGLTKELLPLPSSDYLLTESTLRNWSPVIYKDPGDLKKALKMVDKNNKRLKGTDSELLSLRQNFERIRTFWGDKAGVWLAIDFEAWEMDHTVLTEFGWSSIKWTEGEEVTGEGHLILQNHDMYHNGKYVPDHKEEYKFGTSERVNKTTFKQRINDLIANLSESGPLFLVFHDSSQDIKYLKSIDAPITAMTYLLPEITPSDGIFVLDTSEMFAALEGETGERRAFNRICNHLKIQTDYLHNAGNDAHYTLLAMKAMASGNQLDVQREERWPNQTEPTGPRGGLKVEFKPWEDDSDYSDTEGMVFTGERNGDEVVQEINDAPEYEMLW